VFFAIGVAFEETLVPKIRGSFPGVRIIDTREGIELRRMGDGDPLDTGVELEIPAREVGHVEPHTHAIGVRDPHVWLSPRLAITIAENIRDGLVSLDGNNAKEYSENCDRLTDELVDIDRRIAEVLTPIKGTEILVFHPAYGYFTEAYGLVQIAIENAGGAPGPKYLASVIDRARQRGIRTIFVQEQFSDTMAKTVAKEIGADVVRLDPLAGDYVDNLLRMAEAIRGASETNRNHN
jgi:zinc transport system substrate-binding protein